MTQETNSKSTVKLTWFVKKTMTQETNSKTNLICEEDNDSGNQQ